MSNTYTQLYSQFVFAVKLRQRLIENQWKNDLYKYISGIVQNKKSKMLAINGMSDHIHIFIGYKPSISIPDLIKDIKVASALWINNNNLSRLKFNWQEGYGAFSYSQSHIGGVCQYIANQETHHQKKTFGEEYVEILNQFNIHYEKQYLFEFSPDIGSTPTELGNIPIV
jgi:putative transposase